MRSLSLALAVVCLAAAAVPATDFTYSWGHPQPQGNTVFGLAFASAQEGWAVGGSGFVLHTVDGGEHWNLQHGPLAVAPDLYDVVVTPAGTLVAGGTGAGIYRSSDGGQNWEAPAHPPASDVRDLCLVPGGGISAAGANGVVLVSQDDGLTWEARGPNVGTIKHHIWLTALEGFAVGAGVQHHTTNGGTTWTAFIPSQFFGYNEIYFTDALHGYVQEDFDVWVTANGGATWVEQQNFNNPLYRYRTLVLDPQHWLLACHGEGGEVWETTNAGATWTLRQLGGVVGFPCITQAPGGRVFYGSDAGDLFWSDDLAVSVHNASLNLGGEAQGGAIDILFGRPDGTLFAANQPTMGETPAWLRSDDGGRTWQAPPQTPGLYWVIDGKFFDDQHGVVGRDEVTRVTDDGGETWHAGGSLPATYRLIEFALPAGDRYFVAAYRSGVAGGGILRSVDGGLNWTPVTSGLPFGSLTFWAVDFPTPSIGFAAGATAANLPRLYRTLDGGASWELLAATGLPSVIRTMVWFDAQHGVASLSNPQPGLRRTDDGGLTWTPVDEMSAVDFVERSATEAVAIPFFGDTLALTTDAGLTWEPFQPPFSGSFPGLTGNATAAVPVTGGWVFGGDRNRILVAADGNLTPVSDDPASTVPRSGATLIAAPNPFNPATTLRFRTGAAGAARLTVYDARGRQVRMLVNQQLPAGEHAARWDGRDDAGRTVAAGVYLARVTASSGETTTAKLMLAK
jgi:photosystem II stability/assembly factor-like uncharacterized protein